MPRWPYRVLGTLLDRIYRNDLNSNFSDIGSDMAEQKARVDNLLTANPQPSEVVDARVSDDGTTYVILKDRLDAEHQDVTSKLADKANQTDLDATNQSIENIGNASPKGTYATLTALQTAFPSGTTGIYVVTADGNWYYWNGSAWTVGGTYQSTGLSDEQVKQNNLGVTFKIGKIINSAHGTTTGVTERINIDTTTKTVTVPSGNFQCIVNGLTVTLTQQTVSYSGLSTSTPYLFLDTGTGNLLLFGELDSNRDHWKYAYLGKIGYSYFFTNDDTWFSVNGNNGGGFGSFNDNIKGVTIAPHSYTEKIRITKQSDGSFQIFFPQNHTLRNHINESMSFSKDTTISVPAGKVLFLKWIPSGYIDSNYIIGDLTASTYQKGYFLLFYNNSYQGQLYSLIPDYNDLIRQKYKFGALSGSQKLTITKDGSGNFNITFPAGYLLFSTGNFGAMSTQNGFTVTVPADTSQNSLILNWVDGGDLASNINASTLTNYKYGDVNQIAIFSNVSGSLVSYINNVAYDDTSSNKEIFLNDFNTISDPINELMAHASQFTMDSKGNCYVIYLGNPVSTAETPSDTNTKVKLSVFNITNRNSVTHYTVAEYNQVIGSYTMNGTRPPYEVNLLLVGTDLYCYFNFMLNGVLTYCMRKFDTTTNTFENDLHILNITYNGTTYPFDVTNVTTVYNTATGKSENLTDFMFTSMIKFDGTYYYACIGGYSTGFGSIIVRSTDGINWETVCFPPINDRINELDVLVDGDSMYIIARSDTNGIYKIKYTISTSTFGTLVNITNSVVSRPRTFSFAGKNYLMYNVKPSLTTEWGTIARNKAVISIIDTNMNETVSMYYKCRTGFHYFALVDYKGDLYASFSTDTRKLDNVQVRGNIGFMELVIN